MHHVVTEHGRVDLYGASLRERAWGLIGIADPQFQEALERSAYELGYLRHPD